ncbi:MAG: fructose-bisphosphatase class II [Hyphomonadaceae bacterium]
MTPAGTSDSTFGFALTRATEAAAMAAAALAGRGDEMAADLAADSAMVRALSGVAMKGRVVVGDGAGGEGGVLGRGYVAGDGRGEDIDLALTALEGSTLAAKAMPNALSVIAAGRRDVFLPSPDIYMDKIAVGPGLESAGVDLDAPAGENALRVARAKGVDVREITACVLDRPRHEKIIADLRRAGARVNLIGDGDVAAIIATTMPQAGIDMYVGQGGAPQGVLAAAALKCVGGQMYARLALRSSEDKRLAHEAGIERINDIFALEDLVKGDAVFVATGVTSGSLLEGVTLADGFVSAETLLMSSRDGVVRRIRMRAPDTQAGGAGE